MLDLFRRYQKGIFAITTIFVVISFAFFGVIKNTTPSVTVAKKENKPIGQLFDGSTLWQQDLEKMERFLSTSSFSHSDGREYPNIFNDGVIENDLLASKIGYLIGKQYFEYLSTDLNTRFNKFKQYKPYKHPASPLISMETIWSQFSPQIAEKYQEFQKMPLDNPLALFEKAIELYIASQSLPGPLTRQILYYMQNQYTPQMPDPYLENGDMQLFHAKNLQDWFGDNFVSILCQFIYNTSLLAKDQGFSVTKAEAKASLLDNAEKALTSNEKKPSKEQLIAHYNKMLLTQSLTESEAVEIWQHVLQFRRIMHETKEKVFLDPMMYQDYVKYAAKQATVDLYELPKAFNLQNKDDLYAFEIYRKELGVKQDLNAHSLHSIEQIKKSNLNLLQKEFEIEFAYLSKEELELNVSLKDLWDFETSAKSWKEISKDYPSFASITDKGQRLQALQKLSFEERSAIDQKFRARYLIEHFSIAEEALLSKEVNKQTIKVAYGEKQTPIKGFNSGKELISFLENWNRERVFSQDGKHYYRLVSVKDKGDQLLTFAEIQEKEINRSLVDAYLKQQYQKLKKTNPTIEQLVSFEKAKDQVASVVFASLIKGIKNEMKQFNIKPVDSIDQLAKYRFLSYIHNQKQVVQSENQQEKSSNFWTNQIDLEKKHITLTRNNYAPLKDDNFFRMKENEYSDIITTADAHLAFFVMDQQSIDQQAIFNEINKGRAILGEESFKIFAANFLDELKQKNAINVPNFKEILADDAR